MDKKIMDILFSISDKIAPKEAMSALFSSSLEMLNYSMMNLSFTRSEPLQRRFQKERNFFPILLDPGDSGVFPASFGNGWGPFTVESVESA